MSNNQPPLVTDGKTMVAERNIASNQQPTLLSSLRSVLFVISSALIGFAAFRNTLTWYDLTRNIKGIL